MSEMNHSPITKVAVSYADGETIVYEVNYAQPDPIKMTGPYTLKLPENVIVDVIER